MALGIQPGKYAALLGTLWLAAGGLAVASFTVTWKNPEPAVVGRRRRARAIGTLPGLPASVGAAVQKDLRVLGRQGNVQRALVLGLAGAVGFSLLPGGASLALVCLVMALVFLPNADFACNVFGADRAGVDRYRLLPLTSRQVFLAKNLALFLVAALQCGPLILVTAARAGTAAAIALGLGVTNVGLAMIGWGNLLSVRFPSATGEDKVVESEGAILGGVVAVAATIVALITATAAAERGMGTVRRDPGRMAGSWGRHLCDDAAHRDPPVRNARRAIARTSGALSFRGRCAQVSSRSPGCERARVRKLVLVRCALYLLLRQPRILRRSGRAQGRLTKCAFDRHAHDARSSGAGRFDRGVLRNARPEAQPTCDPSTASQLQFSSLSF
jgi:hypothetical protein